MKILQKVALGGGCHWCTEAVFQSLIGVHKVVQGFVASTGDNATFSEAVIVHYDETIISLKTLIGIHLHTHKSTSDHTMRSKYRSAVYTFTDTDATKAFDILTILQEDFDKKLITNIYPFKAFKLSDKMFHNYYYSNKEKPFCIAYISPKLKVLLEKFSEQVNMKKVKGA